MNIHLSRRAIEQPGSAPVAVQKAFIKQINFLARDLKHPSLLAKKYDEAKNRWQARVNRSWRFYFNIVGDTYVIRDIVRTAWEWHHRHPQMQYDRLNSPAYR